MLASETVREYRARGSVARRINTAEVSRAKLPLFLSRGVSTVSHKTDEPAQTPI
jgi:hypothetical protein